MSTAITIYRGDTFEGTIQIRKRDACSAEIENPFPIPSGSLVELHFPGATSSVILSTANVGEITIVDNNLSTLGYKGSPAKSLLLNVGSKQTITCIVTYPTTEVSTAEAKKILTVVDRANP